MNKKIAALIVGLYFPLLIASSSPSANGAMETTSTAPLTEKERTDNAYRAARVVQAVAEASASSSSAQPMQLAPTSSVRIIGKFPLSFAVPGFIDELAYSPDGRWLAAFGVKGDSNIATMTMFKVDRETGALTPVQGFGLYSPSGWQDVFPLAYSSDSKRIGIWDSDRKELHAAFNIDEKGRLELIQRSSHDWATAMENKIFTKDGINSDIKWQIEADGRVAVVYDAQGNTVYATDDDFVKYHGEALSPDGYCATVAVTVAVGIDALWVYEINQETGALSRITGDVLKEVQQRKKEHNEGRKVLEDTGLGNVPELLSLISEYATGKEESRKKQASATSPKPSPQKSKKVAGEKRKQATPSEAAIVAPMEAENAQTQIGDVAAPATKKNRVQ